MIAYEIRVLAERVRFANSCTLNFFFFGICDFFFFGCTINLVLIAGGQRAGVFWEESGEIERSGVFPDESFWSSCCMFYLL